MKNISISTLKGIKIYLWIMKESSLSSKVTLTRVFSETQMIVDLHLHSCSL